MSCQLPDLVLNDREILPYRPNQFGVVVTHEEALKLLDDGYVVKGYLEKGEDDVMHDVYYLRVRVGPPHLSNDVDLAMLETVGYADLVIHPKPWQVGRRKGIIAFVKSATPKPR